MSASYAQLLRDPRWQRKRLEVLNEWDFTCCECSANDRTLNVHHKLYRKGAKPWEYENHELESLCEPCHQDRHATERRLKAVYSKLDNRELKIVLGYAEAMECFNGVTPIDLIDELHVMGISSWLHNSPHIKARLTEMLAQGMAVTPAIMTELVDSMIYGPGQN